MKSRRARKSFCVWVSAIFLICQIHAGAWAQTPADPEAPSPVSAVVADAPATLSDLQLINQPGFEDPLNRYAWSTVVFKDRLYVGTWNTYLLATTYTNGAEAYRYIGGNQWEQVIDGGLDRRTNMGIRSMIVWDDPDDAPDKGPAIYATTMNRVDGLEVWRTFDGDQWEVVVGDGTPYPNGFGRTEDNNSGRAMEIYNAGGRQWLYLGTMTASGGEIWRTDDGVTWEKVTDARRYLAGRFSLSLSMATMCVYQDNPRMPPALFVGTWGVAGFMVLKSYDGVNFRVVATGGLGNRANSGVARLIVFDNKVWLLTINYKDGCEIFTAGPEPINRNQDWQQVAANGVTDPTNVYAWNAIVHDSGGGPRLYIGTCNPDKGFFLYSVTPDLQWAVEVGPGAMYPSGLGDTTTYGVRSFAEYNGQLVLGLACNDQPGQVWTAR